MDIGTICYYCSCYDPKWKGYLPVWANRAGKTVNDPRNANI